MEICMQTVVDAFSLFPKSPFHQRWKASTTSCRVCSMPLNIPTFHLCLSVVKTCVVCFSTFTHLLHVNPSFNSCTSNLRACFRSLYSICFHVALDDHSKFWVASSFFGETHSCPSWSIDFPPTLCLPHIQATLCFKCPISISSNISFSLSFYSFSHS